MPDTGKLQYFSYPKNTSDLRIETGVQQSKPCIKTFMFHLYYFVDDEISIYYDPMIAKVICRGLNRNEAVQRLDQALSELKVNKVVFRDLAKRII